MEQRWPFVLRRKRAGVSIGTVLLLLLFMTVLATVLASGSATQMWIGTKSLSRTTASNAAQSVVNAAIERVYASGDLSYSGELEIEQGQGTWAGLSFVPDQAQDWGIPYSTNNVGGTAAIPGWGGRSVPPGAIHLIGVGRVREAERTVEAVLRVVEFPYAVACSGPIRTGGSMKIATQGATESELLPADIVSNSEASDSIVLGAGSVVTGDAQSVGGISLAGGAEVDVWGELRPNSDPVQFPELDLQTLEPDNSDGMADVLGQDHYITAEIFEGSVTRYGDLTMDQALTMDGALLYVEGDLWLKGDLQGTGIVVCLGDLRVDGKSRLEGANRLALVSDGTITLQGSGDSASAFRGLVYSRGFRAKDVTVRGSLVVHGSSTASVDLQDANVFYEPIIVQTQSVARTFIDHPIDLVRQGEAKHIFLLLNPESATVEGYYSDELPENFDPEVFAQDIDTYPDVQPVFSVDLDGDLLGAANNPDVVPDRDEMQSALESLAADLITEIEQFGIEDGLVADIFGDPPDIQAPALQSLTNAILFTDPTEATGGGMEFAPGQTLSFGEFLRPEERTRLVFWHETGRLQARGAE